ncbi:MAG TPA: DUF2062 domain-containing protein [Polyangiaceae bacterium]
MPGSRRLLRRVWSGTKRLWERAKREHSTPREVGWSVGVGVFSGCTPFLGLHMWIAVGLASLFRLNRLWAFLGSRVSSNVLFAWIAFVEIEGAHRLRTGVWAPLAPREALTHGRELLHDWLVGAALVGALLGAALGFLAYGAARARASGRTPAAPLPPSSGSRPSAPPAPPG